jgi:hypothetical protein
VRRRRTPAGDPELAPPPAARAAIEPVRVHMALGARLLRVFSPEPYGTRALTFREQGPHARFDHHAPGATRGILYGGSDLVCCLGEFFADSGAIHVPGVHAARLEVTGRLTLLDLRETAALGVGTTQAIGGISQRRTTQAWARYLYGHPDLAGVDGLLYAAANTGRDAVALFERAAGRLAVAAEYELGDPAIDHDLQLAAYALKLPIER